MRASRGWALWWMLLGASVSAPAAADVVTASLNGLEIGIDSETGSVLSLRSPQSGELLAARPDSSGLLDVAYPTETFAPMRLASRFSHAKVTRSGNSLIITWDRLGASRPNLPLPTGSVRARVTIAAAPDGRSVIFSAHIDNESAAPVPQELFPDLWGLQPVEGVAGTRLRLARKVVNPFEGPLGSVAGSPFYPSAELGLGSGSGLNWKEYPAGGYYKDNSLRWLDYGGFRGGLSVFQKKWGSYDWPDVITRRTERDPMQLRMAWAHRQQIEPGKGWDSGEFWFTPHAGGWAKGIEVYRDYVQKMHPPRVLPAHVKEDIGYQSIWMIQTAEADPAQAAFRFADLPRVAEDARRYGIHEVVLWGWNTYSTLPIPIRQELGTVEDLQKGVAQSRALGVNIAPFISITIVRNRFAERYGMQPANEDWTYHDELIPMFRPYYTKFWNGVEIDSNNITWQKDVAGTLGDWIDRGVSSFSWDVFKVHEGRDGIRPPLLSLVDQVRARARAKDPQSTFSGESINHLELEAQALDYLWNWTDYEDAAPITSVLRAPRLNCNIESSALVVDKCFADNLYINAMPRKLDSPNGTATIGENPVLAQALTQAAKLRKQFLPYFTDGTFIGDSVTSVAPNAFVRGYQLSDRLLVIVLNDQQTTRPVSVQSDLGLWLPRAGHYRVTAYDGTGREIGATVQSGPQWFGATRQLEPGALAFFEVRTN